MLAERKLVSSYHELETCYTTEDIYKMIELLDYEDLVEEEQVKEIKRQQAIMASNSKRRP